MRNASSSGEGNALVYADGVHVFGRAGPVLINAWKQKPTIEGLDRFTEYTRQVGEALPHGYTVLSLSPMAMPTPEVRKHITTMMLNPRPLFKGDAVLLMAEGFVASTVRSFFTAVALLDPRKKARSTHIARSTAEAIAFLSTCIPFDTLSVTSETKRFFEASGFRVP